MASLKNIINYMKDNDYWEPKAIVEVIETDERTMGYKTKPHCRIKDEKDSKLYVKVENEEMVGHYWVWQTVGRMGDDYSGYMLLPLSKGKYLKCSYAC